jgi:tetratricopeptide (TPR) repeat protein
MNFSSLADALSHYEAKLDALQQASPKPTDKLILNVLMVRDAIASLTHDRLTLPPDELIKLAELDQQLKQMGVAIATVGKLDQWRTSVKPPQDAWWWYFEVPEDTHPWDRFNWLWGAVSVTCLTLALSLVGDISTRFVTGGPDTFGALAIGTQSVLTLLAGGGALTKAGRDANQRILTSLNIPKYYWHEISAAFSLIVVTGLLGFRFSLPWIATFYNDWGTDSLNQGELTTARYSFQRALRLNPAYLEPHHWLGVLNEELNEFEDARKEYEIAAQGGFVLSAINLARLYILDDQPSAAIAQLLLAEDELNTLLVSQDSDFDRLIELGSSPEVIRYFLLRTQGWARVEQEYYSEAAANLLQAYEIGQSLLEQAQASGQNIQRLQVTQSGIQCLLAQVYEARGNMDAASIEWDGCIRFASESEPGHDEWIRMARQRLSSVSE